MNVIDIILILIIAFAIWRGISNGFLAGVVGLISWLGSLVLTFLLYHHIAELFGAGPTASIWAIPLSFLLTFLFISVVLSLLTNRILAALPYKLHQHWLNKLFGAIPGLAIGVLYAAITAALLLLLPLSNTVTSYTRDSEVAQRLTSGLERVERPFAPALETVNRSINRMTIPPGSSESVRLPFSVTEPIPRAGLESEMLRLINSERSNANLSPLRADEELRQVARRHSADMFSRSYFSHISPDGDTPFDRIRQADITFLTAGENLAIAQTLPLAHEGLMNSPGHRANILRPTFGRVGIGILDGGIYGLMVTQLFRN
ncbi:CvpA family protein [Parapedobacter sp. 10938]|uniref:CvpA family protein n=1 Tax=Parapedobacter flavus TaxID=3110225 RepID=UPI002DB7F01F|nr:CvpA family protein [Parapedobacter sp. 10938]MEC3881675.1 CvpA family protein [Parapedobacter sp. 10938]